MEFNKIIDSEITILESETDVSKLRKYRDILVYHLFRLQHCIEDISNQDRYTIFPIRDTVADLFYQKQRAARWNNHKAKFGQDLNDYETKLTPQLKRIMDMTISFFLLADGIVSIGLTRFQMECETFEQMLYFNEQFSMEAIHAEFYSKVAETFYKSREAMLAAIEKAKASHSIQCMNNFMKKWIHSDKPKWQRFVAASCAEGIFFFNKFVFVLYLSTKGWFHNFSFLTKLTWRDENIHRDSSCAFALRDPDFDPIIAYQIIEEAFEIEKISINEMYADSVEELTEERVVLATMNIVDDLLLSYGLNAKYNVKQPFEWFDQIVTETKVNFFERMNHDYMQVNLESSSAPEVPMQPLNYLDLIPSFE